MIEAVGQISNVGWGVIAFIAVLIFIVLMSLIFRGVKFNLKNKSLSVGNKEEIENQIDIRLNNFKKEIEKRELERYHDEELRKEMFKESMRIDEELSADEKQSVRCLDDKIAKIFEPFFKSDMPLSLVTAKIQGELNERLDYNNMKEKLTVHKRDKYLSDLMNKLQDKYSTFYLQATNLNDKDRYPTWKEIEDGIRELMQDWQDEVVKLICKQLKRKIAFYLSKEKEFKTETYKNSSVTIPVNKNQRYLKDLGGI